MARTKSGEITPADVNAIRPGTSVIPLSSEEENALNTLAKKYNIDKIELMGKLINNASAQTQKSSSTIQSLEKIKTLRENGVIGDSKNNPINDLLQFKLYNDLKTEIGTGNNGKMSTREMMEMNMINMQMLMMQKGMLSENNDNHNKSSESELTFNHKLELMEAKHQADLKEMEARHQSELTRIAMERKFDEIQNNILGEVDALRKKLELQSKIPQSNSTSLVHKDPIRELEEMGGKMQRIKEAISPFLPAHVTAPAPPGPLKNPDGSTDWVGVIERVGGVVGRTIESFNKSKPEMGQISTEQQQQQQQQQQAAPQQERRMTMEEYSEFLLSLPNRTPEQNQWLSDYYDHLERERDKLGIIVTDREEPSEEPAEETRTPQRAPEQQEPQEPHGTQEYQEAHSEVTIDVNSNPTDTAEETYDEPIEDGEKKEMPNENNSSVIARLKKEEEEAAWRNRGVIN